MTVPPVRQLSGTGPQLEAMSRPSSAGGGGLGAGKAGGGKHGGAGGASAAVAAAAGVSSVAGSGSVPPSSTVSMPATGLAGQSSELTALFECPVCFDYVLPPILQCQAGHLVCNQCRQKLSCCPTCRGPLTPSIRNLAMEKVASTLPFPCKVDPQTHTGSAGAHTLLHNCLHFSLRTTSSTAHLSCHVTSPEPNSAIEFRFIFPRKRLTRENTVNGFKGQRLLQKMVIFFFFNLLSSLSVVIIGR